MNVSPPEGTRFVLPDIAAKRLEVVSALRELYRLWGYAPIEVPALERYDPAHPAADRSFKLSDRDSDVLSLRADFTPAVARLAASRGEESAQRYQYCGSLWHTVDPDMARNREFTQIGLELIGVSSARADAELIHLARESVRSVGLAPRVEVGNMGFVRALFDLAEIPVGQRDDLAEVIDRKDVSSLRRYLEQLGLAPDLEAALLAIPDLYGGVDILDEAHRLAPWPEVRAELDRLDAIVAEFEDDSELLIDLGMARRLSYYTGMFFRAYTFDFGQPLLGGGRYDGALLPYAAGFALGLERLMNALGRTAELRPPMVLSLHDEAARRLRAAGFVVERALSTDPKALREYARRRGIPYLLAFDGLEPLMRGAPQREAVSAIVEQVLD